jgi:hypothetical protein
LPRTRELWQGPHRRRVRADGVLVEPLVGSITTLAILLLFWPLIDETAGGLRRFGRRAKSSG